MERNTSATTIWYNLLSTQTHTHTHTCPPTVTRDLIKRAELLICGLAGYDGWAGRAAGAPEDSSSAPKSPSPPNPTTHSRAGSQPGPQAGRLGLPHWGRSQKQRVKIRRVELLCSNVLHCTALCCRCMFLGGHSEWVLLLGWCIFPGPKLDGGLMPLNYLHLLFQTNTYTFKHSLPAFAGAWWKRLSADDCLLGPRVLDGGLWGTPVRLLCLWHTEWQGLAKKMFILSFCFGIFSLCQCLTF